MTQKLITWITALSNSMKSYEPCCVGPPMMDGSWWRVLTKCGPLEKGMANHFSILALRTPWTVWKGKKIWHWREGSSACCSPWGRKESDTTERLNWIELIWWLKATRKTEALLLGMTFQKLRNCFPKAKDKGQISVWARLNPLLQKPWKHYAKWNQSLKARYCIILFI